MAFTYKKTATISQTSGVTDYPCRLVVGESAGSVENFTATLDAQAGSDYDAVLAVQTGAATWEWSAKTVLGTFAQEAA